VSKPSKIKVLAFLLYAVGFTFQYTIPIVVFGSILPYTKEDIGRGLTTIGVIAVLVFASLIIKRLKKRVHEWKRGAPRALVLALFKIVPVVIITLFMRWFEPLIYSIIRYWYRMLIMFVIGWAFDILAEITEASAE
jgi:hypothetical protein